jgi:hypothetical protein
MSGARRTRRPSRRIQLAPKQATSCAVGVDDPGCPPSARRKDFASGRIFVMSGSTKPYLR